MNKGKAVDSTQGVTSPVGPYTVYAAGGLFTQHELAMNVLIKEAVLKMESPYPPEHQESAYRAFRYCPGSGFDQLLTEDELR
jgi:hypothetical protein